jgi:hypothetical protein
VSFNLPRLPRDIAVTGSDGKPSIQLQRWWQSVVTAIETQELLQDATIAQVQATQLELAATQAALVEQLEAILAVTTANAISASWIAPPMVLTASDAGTDATIAVANFTRFYDDGTSKAVTGSNIAGLAYGTLYAVYYDDTTRDNATPIFVATTFTGTARHNFAPGRHFVGTITTPASGGAPTDGGDYTPPGGGDPNVSLP